MLNYLTLGRDCGGREAASFAHDLRNGRGKDWPYRLNKARRGLRNQHSDISKKVREIRMGRADPVSA